MHNTYLGISRYYVLRKFESPFWFLQITTYDTVRTICFQAFVSCGDMMRKSIVFDKKTPNVFYCPLSKPKGISTK